MNQFARALLQRRGSRSHDIVLRSTAGMALGAIVAILLWPGAAPMVGFLCVTMFVNGPLGPLLPAAYEPVLILMGRVYPPLLVAAVGITGIIAVDWLDYYLYRALLQHPVLTATRRSWLVVYAVRLFERAPFFAVWVCALGILPHVAVRVLAPLADYPVRRYLFATFLGRAPRLWLFAALGPIVPVSTHVLLVFTAATIVLPFAMLIRRTLSRRSTRGALPAAKVGLALD